MDFSTSSNTMIQDNSEELMRKNAIYILKKNGGSRNAEEKHILFTWFDGDIIGVLALKDHSGGSWVAQWIEDQA